MRVAAVGACHSDLYIADGDLDAMLAMLPEPPPRPMVLGHEIAGTVEQLGPDAAGVAVGDRVGVHWIAPCGACPNCAVGAETACLTPMTQRSWPGGSVDGGWAEYVKMPAQHLVRIPDALTFEEATPLMCAGMTVYGGFKNGGLQAGQRVAVIGIGGLGHLAIPIAKALGAEVVAVTSSPDKEQLAKDLGADHVVIGSPEASQQLMGLGGVQFVMQTAPTHQVLLNVAGGLFPRTPIVLAGITMDAVPLPGALITLAQLQIMGSVGATHAQMDEVLDLAVQHDIRATTESYPLSEVNAVLNRLRDNEVRFRAVLTPGA